jgi:hypothetical protein
MLIINCTVKSGFLYDGGTNICTSTGGGGVGPVAPLGSLEISAEPLKVVRIRHDNRMLNKLEVFFDEQPQNIEFNTDIEIIQGRKNLVFTSDANNTDKKLILTTSTDFEVNQKINIFFK